VESFVSIYVAYNLENFLSYYAKSQGRGTFTTRLEIPILWYRAAHVMLEDKTDANIMNHAFALPRDLTSRPE
jgi:hypothetical protein